MVNDRGQSALAERLQWWDTEGWKAHSDRELWPDGGPEREDDGSTERKLAAVAILGEHGAYLPDGLRNYVRLDYVLPVTGEQLERLEGIEAAARDVVTSAESYSSDEMFGVYPVGLFGFVVALRAALTDGHE